MKAERYRILWKGQITGPFDREQVEDMLSRNEIGVWAEISEGNSDWKPISDWRTREPAFKPTPNLGKQDGMPTGSPKLKIEIEPPSKQDAPDLPPLPTGSMHQHTEPNSFTDEGLCDNGAYGGTAPQAGGFFYWALMPFKKYTVLEGRARRKEYWLFFLVSSIFPYAAGYAFGFAGYHLGYAERVMIQYAELLGAALYLVVVLPWISVMIRRLHDTNRSGWWWLLVFTGIGSLILLLYLVQEGTEGENEYGTDPKGLCDA